MESNFESHYCEALGLERGWKEKFIESGVRRRCPQTNA
jgi:hypothetical protein